ncbi:hypothetical protein H310_14076 [Aphanomyces invadans]|uniref:DDE Tnp4 domain-containing protein n=1 Tax=Aphanomyces invadans TaxID=157072 RepID=A0A024TBQ7_9STRA|nr:hypothetical protein H310_14076 [Aphanomyces invadans]ETV91409.1 hypothetical protein H310_14076 [Aphanomyces invadans]|eukprot:XP_008880037.1 hypothetical protein H310_14076 [Aphanomyces invadans]
MTDANALSDYQFDVAGIKELGFALGLPAVIVTETRNRVHRDEAMCIVLGHLTIPVRLHTMSTTFGRSRSSLCEIFHHVIIKLYDRWGSLLYLNKKLLAQNMDRYCDAVTAKGAPLSNVFGFIDGTTLQTCRISSTGSGENLQWQVYCGHKRIHCLNYQAVTAPDGICLHFFGPVEGRQHDATMLRHSGLMEQFANDRFLFEGKVMYGDLAYGIMPFLLSGFKGNSLTAKRQEFNKWMS